MQIYRIVRDDVPQAGDLRDGRQEPGDRRGRGRHRRRRRGNRPLGVRLQGQKCSAASRAYVDRSVFDEFVAALVERTARHRHRQPARPRRVPRPRDRRSRGRAASKRRSRKRSARARVFVGGKRIIEGAAADGNYVEPTVVEVPTRQLRSGRRAVRPADRAHTASTRSTRPSSSPTRHRSG